MNKKIIISIISVITLLLAIGFTYAFFSANITGEPKEMSLKISENVEIVFTDDMSINTEVYPGWTTSKTFTIKNNSDVTFYYDIYIKQLLNQFTEGTLQYRITSDNEGYNMTEFEPVPTREEAADTVLKHYVGIKSGALQTYTVEFKYENIPYANQTDDIGKKLTGSIYIQDGTKALTNLTEKILDDNPKISTREQGTFGSVFSGESGLYKEIDEKYLEPEGNTKNVVYYFAGNPNNNWVKFGKEDGQEIWWRIIRTNEDGSVRLLYAGKNHNTEQGYINNKSYSFNTTRYNTKYVGYMYGNSGDTLIDNRKNDTDSLIKDAIDEWYNKNLNGEDTIDENGNKYSAYISKTAIYCNDRATANYAASNKMYYGAAMRLTTAASDSTYGGITKYAEIHPTFKCGGNADGSENGLYANGGDVADKFTGSNSSGIGNEKLEDKPIALMTADEVAYAGGGFALNSANTYYYKNSSGISVTGSGAWWTMSPYYYEDSYSNVFVITGSGSGSVGYLAYSAAQSSSSLIRPVLSLKSCVLTLGSGTVEDPYTIAIDEVCAKIDN